jgi:hypothetical protein
MLRTLKKRTVIIFRMQPHGSQLGRSTSAAPRAHCQQGITIKKRPVASDVPPPAIAEYLLLVEQEWWTALVAARLPRRVGRRVCKRVAARVEVIGTRV